MDARHSLLLAGAIPLVALAVACGGKTTTSTGSLSSSQSSTKGEGDEATNGKATGVRAPRATRSTAGPAPDCIHETTGGSSGGGGGGGTVSCMQFSSYTCASGDQKIECECNATVGGAWGGGSCTCGDLTFAFDCANACTISDADYARCGLPPPPPSASTGSSSSSSGGSSSGG